MLPPNHDLSIALQAELSHVPIPPDDATQQTLKRQVWSYVDERKAAGWPPERILIAVKQIARGAGLVPSTMISEPGGKITSRDALLIEVVSWCIYRYFTTDGH